MSVSVKPYTAAIATCTRARADFARHQRENDSAAAPAYNE